MREKFENQITSCGAGNARSHIIMLLAISSVDDIFDRRQCGSFSTPSQLLLTVLRHLLKLVFSH